MLSKVVAKYLLLVMIISLAGASMARAAANGAFSFLSIGEGARPAGMGEAYTALADDVNAIYWNPAGLAAVRAREITTSYLQYLVDVNIGYAGYAFPAFKGGVGIGVMYVDYGAINELTYDNPSGTLGTYRPYDLVVTGSYGRTINKRFRVGASLKGIHEDIKGYTANAVAADAGVLYKPPVKHLIMGFTVQNCGVQTKAFVDELHSLPTAYKLGAGYGLLDDALKVALDYCYYGNAASSLNGGAEYLLNQKFAFRLGYQTRGQDLKTGSNTDMITGFSAGVGARFGMFSVDYAFVPYNELGQTQRLSLSVYFGNTPSKSGVGKKADNSNALSPSTSSAKTQKPQGKQGKR
jgi:long-subunit fatty acid transport protein